MKIGVFGGTFNPVHLGHLNCLKSVAEQAGLDKMIVMPDRIPPHKQAEDLASSEDRLNMCRLAFADIPCVEISDWELKQEGKSYSVITLRHLKEIYPHDKLFFIMGSDMLLSFEEWYQYKEILSLSALICAPPFGDKAMQRPLAAPLKGSLRAKPLTKRRFAPLWGAERRAAGFRRSAAKRISLKFSAVS